MTPPYDIINSLKWSKQYALVFIMRTAAFVYSFGICALSTIFLRFGCHKTKEKSSVDFTDVKKMCIAPSK